MDWFVYIEEFLHPWDKPNLIMLIFLVCCWIQFARIFWGFSIYVDHRCCCCSVTKTSLTVTPWPAGCQASLSLTVSWSFPKFMSIESVMPPNCLKLCHSLLFLPSISPNIRDFSNESALHIRWPKYRSSSFSISLSNEYSKLISFKIDGFYLLAFQGTLKSLLQQHSLKAPILWCSAFFIAQLSHRYMTAGKTIALMI